MNLRSYVRGIGAGLIVAALVLGFSRAKMSDAEIKKRASELGMTESSILTSQSSTSDDTSVEDDKSGPGQEKTEAVSGNDVTDTNNNASDNEDPEFLQPDKETVPPIIPSADDNEDPENKEKKDDKSEEKPDINNDSEDPEEITPPAINPLPSDERGFIPGEDGVVITVIRGDSSVSVARRMFEAGLVESAVEFDKYLCDNGYDKVISVGTYNIEYGLDFDEMARIITRR